MPLKLSFTGSNSRWDLAHSLVRPAPIAANDDTFDGWDSGAIFQAALRHFGTHGLGAARVACGEAEAALAAGDHAGAERWRDVCRALDKRAAAALDRRLAESSDLAPERHHSSR